MTDKELIGSYIYKDGERWRVRFYNFLLVRNENLGTYSTFEEAKKAYSLKQIDFYRNNKSLLPKSIGVHNSVDYFRLGFNWKNLHGRNNFLHLGMYETLEEAMEARRRLIFTIIE